MSNDEIPVTVILGVWLRLNVAPSSGLVMATSGSAAAGRARTARLATATTSPLPMVFLRIVTPPSVDLVAVPAGHGRWVVFGLAPAL